MDILSNEEGPIKAAAIKSFKDSLKLSTELYENQLDTLESIGKEYINKLRDCQEYYTNITIYRKLINDLGVETVETVREFSPRLVEAEHYNAVQEFKDRLNTINEANDIDVNNSDVMGASVDETNASVEEKTSSVEEIEVHNTTNNNEETPKRVRGVQQYVLKIMREATGLLTTQEVSELVYKRFGKGISYTSITNSLSRLRKPEHDKIRRFVDDDGVSYYGIVKWFHLDGTPKQEILQTPLVESEYMNKENEETQEAKVADITAS